MSINLAQLKLIFPLAGDRVVPYYPHLLRAMDEFAISKTKERVAAFLAQVGHESGEFRFVEENLNYSTNGLMKTWPARFPTQAIAAAYARRPEKIANKVYANRMGNGPESSGDGWRHRGAGLIQLTGKTNQGQAAQAFGIDLSEIGAWLRKPEGACRSAAWFWHKHGLNELADGGDFITITKRINGGLIGLTHRLALWENAKNVLGCDA